MELTKYQKDLLDNTDKIMEEYNLIEEKDYDVTIVKEK